MNKTGQLCEGTMKETEDIATTQKQEDILLSFPINQYFEIDDDTYHESGIISSHGLMKFEQSPAHFLQSKVERKKKRSSALEFGTAMHSLLLQPKNFEANYLCLKDPKITRRHKAFDEAVAGHPGKTVLTFEDVETARAMEKVWLANKRAQTYLKEALHLERAAIVTPAVLNSYASGLDPIKARFKPDIVHPEFLFDYKTTSDASTQCFRKDMATFSYDIQAAAYLHFDQSMDISLPPKRFCFIAQEKEAPYAINFIEIDPDWLDLAWNILKVYSRKYVEALEAKAMHEAYSDELKTVSYPVWRQSFAIEIGAL